MHSNTFWQGLIGLITSCFMQYSVTVHRNSIKRRTLFDKDEYLRWVKGLDKFSFSSSSPTFLFEAMY